MKKVLALLLALVMCLSLAGCKSEEVKAVESMIESIGEVSLESESAIVSAEKAYNALSDEDKSDVENYSVLTAARDRLYELMLVGEWMYCNIFSLGSNYIDQLPNQKMSVLSLDMTGIFYEFDSADKEGTPIQWSVENGILICRMDEWNISGQYKVVEEDTGIYLQKVLEVDTGIYLPYEEGNGLQKCLRIEDFHDFLNEVFLIVDLTPENASEYLEPYFLKPTHDYDAFGELVEVTATDSTLRLRSKIIDDGWIYVDSTDDCAIEISYPDYTITRTHYDSDRVETVGKYSAGFVTLSESCPFIGYFPIELDHENNDFIEETDLSVDEITFSRAKGKLYFINSKYVTDVIVDNNTHTRSIVTTFFDYPYDTGYGNHLFGNY